MIGSLIQDRYQIVSELGRGGMGAVYRAEDTLLERPVAIKFVTAVGLGTEGQARLLQEARAAARLNHPNIVAVHDVGQAELSGQEGTISFIVMELVEGQALRGYQPQNLGETIDIARAICEALAAAHNQGIIHRDLKPENVMLTPGGTIKLMDFGLARISGKTRLTQQGAFVGTLSYVAPEVILGREASARSDLYALGVMLYEMSAGRPPFEADTLAAVISQHLHAPIVPPGAYNEAIPPALDQLIIRLLSKQPEERPESAEAVSQILTNLSLVPTVDQQPTTSNQLNRLVRGRMVGREEELAEAVALWEKSTAGEGQLLLISGDPGIGKTRLVKELNAYAEISGGVTLLGPCFAHERTPYGPIAQMVQTSLENGFNLKLPQPVMADLLALAPELRLRYPDVTANERLDPEVEQQRLFESIVTWFGALTIDRQLLLVVEDIHWADSGSLAFLRYLARRLGHRRAMVIATYREIELDEALPFQEMLQDVSRERLAARIKLTRLDKDETRDLLATLFAEEVTPEFLDGIYRETEGNPFFVEEVCKTLVDSGSLYFEDGRWQRPEDIADLEIPQGIRSTIQSRLGKLSAEEQNTLQVAALLGREFEYELLVTVSELDEESLIDVLEKAEGAQLIEELQPAAPGASPNFTFTHALIHATLLSGLSTLRKRRHQRKVAQALEESYPERSEELAPLLGRYFAEAGDGERGVKYLLMAGDAAREVFAYNEAIEAYEDAQLILNEKGDHERAARTLMKLGLTYHNIFAFDSAQKAYEQGFIEWRQAAESPTAGGLREASAPHPFRSSTSMFVPGLLDPSRASYTVPIWFINQLFSGLLQLTAEDEVLPDVAESWDVLDGGRTYVFHLRSDVKWSDGRPVTSADFSYAWRRALHPDNDQGMGGMLFDISGAKALKQGQLDDPDKIGVQTIDSHTLAVNLERPSSYFLQIMASFISRPVPEHVVERHGSGWTEPGKIVTNGPFRLESVIPGRSLLLERYEDYHGRFRGNLSQAEFDIVVGNDALRMYEGDELDIIYPYYHMSFEDAKRFIQLHPDDYISQPDHSTRYLAFDVTRPPFDDLRVRQALVLATDRNYLAGRVTLGSDFPAGGGLLPPMLPGHVPGIALPYDPVMAGQKLAEAGFPDGRGFPVVEGLFDSASHLRLMEHLAAHWETILGIQVSVESLDYAEFLDRLERDPPNLWTWGWSADYPDPDSYLRYANWLRHGGWQNERYEMLVEGARRIADQGQRMAMYRQAEQILVEEAPVVPLTYGREHVLVKSWLPGLPASVINGVILKDIVIEPH